MRQILMLLLCVVALAAIFLMVGCTDGGPQGSSQAEQEDRAPKKKSENVELALRPGHDSGVSGTASLEDTSDGVLVKLNLRNLPKPNTFSSLTSTRALARKGRRMSTAGLMARKGTAMSTAMSTAISTGGPVTSTAALR
jgi:ABC-type oligopeptide transport system substrate-binding subunit